MANSTKNRNTEKVLMPDLTNGRIRSLFRDEYSHIHFDDDPEFAKLFAKILDTYNMKKGSISQDKLNSLVKKRAHAERLMAMANVSGKTMDKYIPMVEWIVNKEDETRANLGSEGAAVDAEAEAEASASASAHAHAGKPGRRKPGRNNGGNGAGAHASASAHAHATAATRLRAQKDEEKIEQVMAENRRLRAENRKLKKENEELRQKNEELERRIQTLEDQVQALIQAIEGLKKQIEQVQGQPGRGENEGATAPDRDDSQNLDARVDRILQSTERTPDVVPQPENVVPQPEKVEPQPAVTPVQPAANGRPSNDDYYFADPDLETAENLGNTASPDVKEDRLQAEQRKPVDWWRLKWDEVKTLQSLDPDDVVQFLNAKDLTPEEFGKMIVEMHEAGISFQDPNSNLPSKGNGYRLDERNGVTVDKMSEEWWNQLKNFQTNVRHFNPDDFTAGRVNSAFDEENQVIAVSGIRDVGILKKLIRKHEREWEKENLTWSQRNMPTFRKLLGLSNEPQPKQSMKDQLAALQEAEAAQGEGAAKEQEAVSSTTIKRGGRNRVVCNDAYFTVNVPVDGKLQTVYLSAESLCREPGKDEKGNIANLGDILSQIAGNHAQIVMEGSADDRQAACGQLKLVRDDGQEVKLDALPDKPPRERGRIFDKTLNGAEFGLKDVQQEQEAVRVPPKQVVRGTNAAQLDELKQYGALKDDELGYALRQAYEGFIIRVGRGATEGNGEQSYELMDHYAPEIEAMLKVAETRAQQKGYKLPETKPAKSLNCSHDETGRMHSWEERFMRIGPMYAFDNVDREEWKKYAAWRDGENYKYGMVSEQPYNNLSVHCAVYGNDKDLVEIEKTDSIQRMFENSPKRSSLPDLSRARGRGE